MKRNEKENENKNEHEMNTLNKMIGNSMKQIIEQLPVYSQVQVQKFKAEYWKSKRKETNELCLL